MNSFKSKVNGKSVLVSRVEERTVTVNVICIICVPSRRKQQLMKDIQSYKPDIKTVHEARVLLVGPVGGGKSSFFNSINSAFRGNMTCQAIAGTAGKSVTTQVLAQVLLFVIHCRYVEAEMCPLCLPQPNQDSQTVTCNKNSRGKREKRLN